MLKSDLRQAEIEAKRFLAKIKELEQSNDFNSMTTHISCPSTFSASVKRSSMDLTKSLAKLRKSRW